MHLFRNIWAILWIVCTLQLWGTLSFPLFATNDNALNPVILVPGDGGSQMEARINKSEIVHYICSKQAGWYNIWLDMKQMVPKFIDCWADNMRLVYDNVTHTTRDNDGVEIRIPGFGSTDTVEYLDSTFNLLGYFAGVVKQLVTLGYKKGVNLHGAPYDFRKAANEHGQYFVDLKALVEATYTRNGNKKVVFICHSMGSPMTLYFLNSQTQAWKDQYVKAFITMAGVWGGTVRAMKVYAVGDNLGTGILVSENALMTMQRTNPSLAWLMPSERLWKSDEVLVQSPNINITVGDLTTFYEMLDHQEGAMMHDDVKDLVKELTPPGVETYCLHTSGVNTVEKLIYPSFPASTPVLVNGDGDGTVNIRSLMACTEWEGKQEQKFHHHIFPNLDHLQVLRSDAVTEYVKNIVKELILSDIAPPQIEIV